MPDRRSLWASKAPDEVLWSSLEQALEQLSPRNGAFVTRDQRLSAHLTAVTATHVLRRRRQAPELPLGLSEPQTAAGSTRRAIEGL